MTQYREYSSAHTLLGVPGALVRTISPTRPEGCWLKQIWVSTPRKVQHEGKSCNMTVEVRFDDQCKNGYNNFAITGRLVSRSREVDMGGCVHDEIEKYIPELAPLIKWHGCSPRGPMHYLANVTYLAGNRDHNGKMKGEPWAWDDAVRFANFPISYKLDHRFAKWLKACFKFNRTTQPRNPAYKRFEVVAVPYVGTGKFSEHYSFDDYTTDWATAPFKTRQAADEFRAAMEWDVQFVKIPTLFSEGKDRQLDLARSSAIWPEATDEQLCLPKEELTALLEARLPQLVADFRAQIKACGLAWTPEEFLTSVSAAEG